MSGSISNGGTIYNYDGAIFQSFTVAVTGLYDIVADGAQGGVGATAGFATAGSGGRGAEIGGDFMLNKGDILSISVGGQGENGVGDGGGGGGGGSFVFGPGGTPLVIAGGGGGGGGAEGTENASSGTGGFISGSGGAGAGPNPGTGGTGRTGGGSGGDDFGGNSGAGAGGGGLISAGGNSSNAIGGSAGGGAGGVGIGNVGGGAGDGGWGGGGGTNIGGGGGGGYSGGGGGGFDNSLGNGGGGGGGGSVDGSSLTNADLVQLPGQNDGNGLVTITPLVPNNPNPQPVTVPEGQTTANLYSTLVNDVDAANPDAQVSITSIGLSNTMGFAYLDTTDGLLTYTADGFQPGAKQPQDSFTYTASNGATGTVNVTVTGPNVATQVGTSGNDTLTANGSGQRLIGGNGNDMLTGNGSGQLLFGGNGNDTITAYGAKSTIWGGTGTNTVTLNGAPQTVVLQQGGTDNISGFNLHNDVLDLTQVLAEVQKSFSASDFQVTDSGNNATLSYVGTPSFTGGSPLATLIGVGPNVTLQTLTGDNVLKVS